MIENKPKPFPKWNEKEHPDFGFDVNALVKYVAGTERAKRELVAWLHRKIKENTEGGEFWSLARQNVLQEILEVMGDK